jgi:hypothetical protein
MSGNFTAFFTNLQGIGFEVLICADRVLPHLAHAPHILPESIVHSPILIFGLRLPIETPQHACGVRMDYLAIDTVFCGAGNFVL